MLQLAKTNFITNYLSTICFSLTALIITTWLSWSRSPLPLHNFIQISTNFHALPLLRILHLPWVQLDKFTALFKINWYLIFNIILNLGLSSRGWNTLTLTSFCYSNSCMPRFQLLWFLNLTVLHIEFNVYNNDSIMIEN